MAPRPYARMIGSAILKPSIHPGCGTSNALSTIEGRTINARRRAGSAAWFDFEALCDGPRSQLDYLELARSYPVIFLSNVPAMTADMGDRARRFTWLVDILYDHRVKLIASADAMPDQLYERGEDAGMFVRTASRLHEMQSEAWLALPHLT